MYKSFLIIITYIFFFNIYLYSGSIDYNFNTSTTLTSDLAIVSRESQLEPVKILTSKDIKLIGVENIPDLLSYVAGVNIYRINHSTIDYSIRGFAANFRLYPKVLIDGMEFNQVLTNKVFFYNFPVDIDDIDRIEIIKDPTKFVNGYDAAGGIINIVTKKPELLGANYINSFIGSNNLLNSNFSFNNYFKNTYFKINGGIRKINKYHSKNIANHNQSINLTTTNFFEHSQLFTKFSYTQGKLNLLDLYRIKIGKKMNVLPLRYKLKDEKLYRFLADYNTEHTDISFYLQSFNGNTGISPYHSFYNNFFRLSLKKIYRIKNFIFKYGVISEFSKNHIATMGSGKREGVSLYLNADYEILPHIKLTGFIKNYRARNLGNEFTYKTAISYTSEDNTFFAKLGYAKNYENPNMFYQYYSLYGYTPPLLGVKFPYRTYPQANLKPIKIFSTILTLSKKINKFKITSELYYNRIVDIPRNNGKLTIFPPMLDINMSNFFDFTIHGIETTLEYNLSKRLTWTTSAYFQHFKNKSSNVQGNYLTPKYKLFSTILYNSNIISGSFKWSYVPRIRTVCAGNTDYISTVDLSFFKTFLNGKTEASLNIQNLFKDTAKDTIYGIKPERNLIFKIKYNF